MNTLFLDRASKIKFIICLTALLIFSVLLPLFRAEYAADIIFFLIFYACIFLYARKVSADKNEYSTLFRMCLIAFTIRVLVVVCFSVFPSLNFPSDSGAYEEQGLKIAQDWTNGHILFNLPASHFFYYMQNAVVYYIFGFYPSLVKLINCFLGVMAGINLYQINKKLFNKSSGKIATFLVLFFPSILLHQTMNMKEALVVFLYVLIIKKLIYLIEEPRLSSFILTLFYCILLTLTRNYAGVFFTFIACFVYFKFGSISFSMKLGITAVAFALLGIVTYKAQLGWFGLDYLKSFNLSHIDSMRKSEYRGGSEVLQNISMRSFSELPKFIPIALVYFLFSPFPWQLDGSLLQYLSLCENICWYFLFAFLPVGIYYLWKKNRNVSVLLYIILIGFCSLYTLQMGNMGLAYRMKASILPIFFIFISIGLSKVSERFVARVTGGMQIRSNI